ncbi:hypothetical protein LWI29_028644 [Acer saccharum]|uniref:NAC domain-containing protein n=1 Tax=Acer saccharum TaxID=4024 RepID=A0AA39S7H7_ACESA|nr:hypothetical protein LWI29_028644 [Acer saccharum]
MSHIHLLYKAMMWACKYLVGVQSFFIYSVRAGNSATEPYIVAHNMDLLSGLNLHQTPQKTMKQHKEPKISSLAADSDDHHQVVKNNEAPAVGYQFYPTDKELIVDYLVHKVHGNPLPSTTAVEECDVYCDSRAWKGLFEALEEDILYFFTRLQWEVLQVSYGQPRVKNVAPITL